MVNLNNISSIETAKDEKYYGESLSDEQKKIFEHVSIKVNGAFDLGETKKAATLLENVKKAEKVTLKDTALLGILNVEKTANSNAYKAVNSCDALVDKAITRLGSLSTGEPDEETIAQLETKLIKLRADIKTATDEETKKKAEIEAYINGESSANQLKLINIERQLKGIDKLITAIKTDSTADNILKGIVVLNQSYGRIFNSSSWIETDVDSYAAGRRWVASYHLDELVFRFVELLRELDIDKFKASIDSVVTSASDRKTAKDSLDRLLSVKWSWEPHKVYGEKYNNPWEIENAPVLTQEVFDKAWFATSPREESRKELQDVRIRW